MLWPTALLCPVVTITSGVVLIVFSAAIALITALNPVEVDVDNEVTADSEVLNAVEVLVLREVRVLAPLDKLVDVLVLNEPMLLCAPSMPCST